MTLDLRLVPNAATYLLKVLVGGKVVCLKTICTVNRLHKAISVKPSVESDIYPDTDIMYQEAIIKCKDHDVPCAENVIKMVLLGTTAYESDVNLGEGKGLFSVCQSSQWVIRRRTTMLKPASTTTTRRSIRLLLMQAVTYTQMRTAIRLSLTRMI